jgi:hypothetical protein
MRRNRAPIILLVGAALIAASCRQDAGLSPEGDAQALLVASAQCLAPSGARTVTDPAPVGSRLASVFLRGRDGVVCLSEENGRWRLRGAADAAAVAE